MKKFIQTGIATLCIATALFTTGCNTAKQESVATFDLVAAKQQIEAANQNFSALVSKGDSVGIATECYTSDAKFFLPNGPVIKDRKNIQSLFSSLLNSGINKAEFSTTEVWGDQNILTEEGSFVLTTATGKIAESGKYLVLWKKEDGKWKLFRDCYNSNLPIAP